MALAPTPVSPARPVPIDDRQLDLLTRIAHDARNDLCTEGELHWFIASAGPLLEELRRWRALGTACDVPPEAVNVIHLPVAR